MPSDPNPLSSDHQPQGASSMTILVSADQLSVSADDPEVRDAAARLLLNAYVGFVVTITTRHLDEHQVTLLPRDPGDSPDVVHGAAFVDNPRHEPAAGLPVIRTAEITHIHVH